MHAISDQRQGRVEFELTVAAAGRHRLRQPVHVQPDLHQHFTQHGIHFTRHDRGSRLQCRQSQFGETRARSRAEQANVVGDFREARRHRRKLTSHLDAIITRGLRLEVIARFAKRKTGFSGEYFAHARGKLRRRMQPGAHRRAPDREFAERRHRALRTLAGLPDLHRIAGKFLPQGEGNGIHQMGATDLHDRAELDRFFFQR